MPSLLNMNHHELSLLKRSLPEIKGRMLGRGVFSAVYPRTEDSVWKLTMDSHNYELAKSGLSDRSRSYPRLIEDRGIVGTAEDLPVYLIAVEKLISNNRHPVANQIADSFCNRYKAFTYINQVRSREATYTAVIEGMKSDPELPDNIVEALSLLNSYIIGLDTFLDLGNVSNFMFRENGELVFNDPICDQELLDEHITTMNPDYNPFD